MIKGWPFQNTQSKLFAHRLLCDKRVRVVKWNQGECPLWMRRKIIMKEQIIHASTWNLLVTFETWSSFIWRGIIVTGDESVRKANPSLLVAYASVKRELYPFSKALGNWLLLRCWFFDRLWHWPNPNYILSVHPSMYLSGINHRLCYWFIISDNFLSIF